MPVPVRRIDHGPPVPKRESLEQYVASQMWQRLQPLWVDVDGAAEIMVDADADNMGDYWRVEVFISDPKAVGEAERVAADLEKELRRQRIATYIRIRSWTGPWVQ